jgi:hypothetical protein
MLSPVNNDYERYHKIKWSSKKNALAEELRGD